MADWIREESIPSAWISLDENDNESHQYIHCLVLAIKPHLESIESILTILNGPQQVQTETLMAEFINQLIKLQTPLVLVLDDYHVIQNPKIHSLMQFLFDHQPPHLQIVLLTRSDPPINLARMRARRQMIEIRQNDLSFTETECQHLFTKLLPDTLSEQQINELALRTEGWVVGLHLAAISLKDQNNPALFIEQFSGSHRFIIDYLTSEVLSGLSGELRSFVCQAAVLNPFCADLLDDILALNNSHSYLTQIEGLNLFLIPLDENRKWYRYHHLISTLFQAEVPGDKILQIKRRAAIWFEAHQQPFEAVRLAFESNSFDLACQFIRSSVIQVAESGKLTTALQWLENLPEDVLYQNPDLAVIRIWLLIYNGRFQHAFQGVQKMESNLSFERTPPAVPVQGMLLGIKAWSQTIFGQKMDLANLQLAYQMMGDEYKFFSPLMLLALGQAQKESQLMDEARQSFEQGIALTEKAENPVTHLILRNNLAFLLNGLGQRQAAINLCKEAITRYCDAEGNPDLLAGIPMIPYGCFLYQNGDLQESEKVLTRSIHLIRRLGLTEILSSPATQILQLIFRDQGRYEEALVLNQDTHQEAIKAGMTASAGFSDLLQAWIHYMHGDQNSVLFWINNHPLQTDTIDDAAHLLEVLLHARVLADQGDREQALSLIQKAEEGAHTSCRLLDWIQLKLNQAIILDQFKQGGEAQAAFQLALIKADAIHFRQVFYQEIKHLHSLIDSCPTPLPSWLKHSEEIQSSPAKNALLLINPPSEREMEILRLVSAGLSNADIAERLFITIGTTKWHLNHIYAKLGAVRRTDAVVKAQEYGLI